MTLFFALSQASSSTGACQLGCRFGFPRLPGSEKVEADCGKLPRGALGAWLNNHNIPILSTMHCNNDVAALSWWSAPEIVYYVTNYVTKVRWNHCRERP